MDGIIPKKEELFEVRMLTCNPIIISDDSEEEEETTSKRKEAISRSPEKPRKRFKVKKEIDEVITIESD